MMIDTFSYTWFHIFFGMFTRSNNLTHIDIHTYIYTHRHTHVEMLEIKYIYAYIYTNTQI